MCKGVEYEQLKMNARSTDNIKNNSWLWLDPWHHFTTTTLIIRIPGTIYMSFGFKNHNNALPV